jgi:hypothetical protein
MIKSEDFLSLSLQCTTIKAYPLFGDKNSYKNSWTFIYQTRKSIYILKIKPYSNEKWSHIHPSIIYLFKSTWNLVFQCGLLLEFYPNQSRIVSFEPRSTEVTFEQQNIPNSHTLWFHFGQFGSSLMDMFCLLKKSLQLIEVQMLQSLDQFG